MKGGLSVSALWGRGVPAHIVAASKCCTFMASCRAWEDRNPMDDAAMPPVRRPADALAESSRADAASPSAR